MSGLNLTDFPADEVPLTPILSDMWGVERSQTLDAYRMRGGYQDLEEADSMEPANVLNAVKNLGLRGHGGAGFLTGLKWPFLPPDDGGPRYLVVNADESELGTCKDIPHSIASPYVLLEGMAICSRAIRCEHAFIYLRGEVAQVYRRLLATIREAAVAGILGGPKITTHAGAGAYICGEETALLDSLEGRRGHPHLEPPFPAAQGLFAHPTVINNVETISQVAGIFKYSDSQYTSMGTEKSKEHRVFSISGHVKYPGQFEAPFRITIRQLLGYCGEIRAGRELKFWAVGGSSAPIFAPAELDVPLTHEEVVIAGSMLATRAIQVFDETTPVVRVITRWADFYQYESCGKCTPCREGTYWMKQIMHRLEADQGREDDIEKLLSITSKIGGRCFCALGGAAVTLVKSGIAHFREEFEQGYHTPAWGLLPYRRSAIFDRREAQPLTSPGAAADEVAPHEADAQPGASTPATARANPATSEKTSEQ